MPLDLSTSLVPNPLVFENHYGALAFGVISFLIIFGAVWWMFIRPEQERARREEDERTKQLSLIQQYAELNNKTAQSLASAVQNLAMISAAQEKITEDHKIISKLQDATLGRADRILERLDNIMTRHHEDR